MIKKSAKFNNVSFKNNLAFFAILFFVQNVLVQNFLKISFLGFRTMLPELADRGTTVKFVFLGGGREKMSTAGLCIE